MVNIEKNDKNDGKNGIESRRDEKKKITMFFLPILRRVVIANVAIDRLASETNPSISSWHLETLREEDGMEECE